MFLFSSNVFQFVVLGFKARNAGKYEHPITRLVLSALPLHLSNEAFPLFTFHEMTTRLCPSGSIRNRINVMSSFSTLPQSVHLIIELTESVRSKHGTPVGTGLHACCKKK